MAARLHSPAGDPRKWVLVSVNLATILMEGDKRAIGVAGGGIERVVAENFGEALIAIRMRRRALQQT